MVPPELEPLASGLASLPVVPPELLPLPLLPDPTPPLLEPLVDPESLAPPLPPPEPASLPPPLASGGAHVPAAQVCEQQSLKLAHDWPLALHCTDWHWPIAHEWLQQSEAVAHALPSLAHAGGAHVPALHDPLQHALFAWHAWPAGAHVTLTQRPPVQVLLQHWLSCVHAALMPRHAPPPHIPSTHDWLQQSLYIVHAAPVPAHPCAAPLLLPPTAASGARCGHPVPKESVLPWLAHPPKRTRAAIVFAARNDSARAFMRSPRRSRLDRGATISNARTPPRDQQSRALAHTTIRTAWIFDGPIWIAPAQAQGTPSKRTVRAGTLSSNAPADRPRRWSPRRSTSSSTPGSDTRAATSAAVGFITKTTRGPEPSS